MAILTDRTELAEAPNDADMVHVVDVSDTTDNAAGTSKKMTFARIKAYVEAFSSYFNVSTNTLDDITTGSTNKHFTATDETKLDGIEASADVTDETNVTAALDNASLTDVGTPASTDRILLQDASDTNALKYADFSEFGSGGSPEGTSILSTGETGGSKFLREDGDGTSSWQAIGGGGDALVANPLSQFAATTSAQLAGVISDETGSGSAVFATSPTLVAPTLGAALATSINGVVPTEAADGFTLEGGTSSSRTLTVTGGDITLTGGTPSKGGLLVGDAGNDYDELAVGTNDQIMVADSGQTRGLKYVDLDSGINFIIDGGGSAITTGIKGDVEIPYDCTIEQVTMLADVSGSAVVDLWVDTYANFPPTDADTITASAVPTISSATKSQDATLTGWTTALNQGDTLRFNVDSAATITRLTISLKLKRTF